MKLQRNFLITIDTEGDNLWSNSQQVTTRNASYLPRFQALCEQYQFIPTYLTNFEMAHSPTFQKFGRDILQRNVGEIGMHLHAWDMPPEFALTEDDSRHHPYLIEYPEQIMRAKIAIMTDLLEQTFGVKMVSHRAGRWSFDDRYARILLEHEYRVDCSVTPHVSWKNIPGDPNQAGGTDYTHFPGQAYFLDLTNISVPGNSALLEVPVSIEPLYGPGIERMRRMFARVSILRRSLHRLWPPLTWLRPNGHNLQHILKLLRHAADQDKDYVEFILHSSELMPGGSPQFPTTESIERLYHNIERVFAAASKHFAGCSLADYYEKFVSKSP